MSKVATEAQTITKGLTDGIQAHDLKPVLDQLNSDKASMSAKDYASLFQDMNKDLKTALPGLTLTDDAATGSVNLTAQDKYGMNMNVTGDAAGASNLQQVAADAQMPNPDAIIASKMQGAKLTSTDASGDQNYTLPDGSQIMASKVDDGMVYIGNGNTVADNFTVKTDASGSSIQYGDNTGISLNPAANEVTLYDKNLNASGTITRNADGTVTDKKISHLGADFKAIAQGVGVVATAAVANYDDSQIAANPNLYPGQKIWRIDQVNDSAANLINTIVPPQN
jgi:WD40 repeat protein